MSGTLRMRYTDIALRIFVCVYAYVFVCVSLCVKESEIYVFISAYVSVCVFACEKER